MTGAIFIKKEKPLCFQHLEGFQRISQQNPEKQTSPNHPLNIAREKPLRLLEPPSSRGRFIIPAVWLRKTPLPKHSATLAYIRVIYNPNKDKKYVMILVALILV